MARVATARKPVKNLAPKAQAEDIPEQVEIGGFDDDLDDLFPPLTSTKEYLNCLFYGREGSSKTTTACSAANFGQVLVINSEGGLKIRALKRQGVNVDNIRVWPNPEKPTPITRISLEKLYQRVKAQLMKNPDAWFAIVMDSATEITETLVGRVSDNRIQKARDRDIVIDDFQAYETDRNDYGTMSKQFRDLMRKFRDLPCHFIVTALERRDVDEDTGITQYGPAVSPGLQKDLLGYVDLAMFFKAEDEDGPFRALTRKTGKNRAKDRLGSLPRILAEPSFERILAYAEEELTEQEDELQKLLPEPKPKKVLRAGRKKTTGADTPGEDEKPTEGQEEAGETQEQDDE